MLTRRQWTGVAVFVVLLSLAAQISFALPGIALPQTAQTIVVLLTGVFLGFNAAAFAVFCYLALGAAGVPVFADGGAGFTTLFGPSGGYLIAFWFTAAVLGLATDSGHLKPATWQLLLWMLLGHAMILLIGAGMLSATLGIPAAWFNGVQPFIPGAVGKSLIAALVIWLSGSFRSWFSGNPSWQKQTTRP